MSSAEAITVNDHAGERVRPLATMVILLAMTGGVVALAWVVWFRPSIWDVAESPDCIGTALTEYAWRRGDPDPTPGLEGWTRTYTQPLGWFGSGGRVAAFRTDGDGVIKGCGLYTVSWGPEASRSVETIAEWGQKPQG